MPLFGVAFYLAAAWVTWRTTDPTRMFGLQPRAVLAALGAIGIAVSIFLTGVEAFVIQAYFTWCLVQAVAGIGLAAAAFRGWATTGQEAPTRDASRRAQRQAERLADNERRALGRYGVVTAGAMSLLVLGLLAGGTLAGNGPAPSPSTGSNLAPASAPRIGGGPVTVVEFADFQCPACAATAPELQQLVDNGSITLVYRYFPLPQHPLAQLAATAAAAADVQGKFWPLHDKLFETQSSWENLSAASATTYITQLASQVGLDVTRWRADWQSSAVAATVTTDATAAAGLGLPQTPSIFINGTFYTGGLSLAELQSAVAAAR